MSLTYRPFFLLLTLLLGFATLQAQQYQEGYIVSNEGDTILGLVKVQNKFAQQRKLHFVDYNGAKVHYHPERIAAYGYGNEHFESLPLPFLYTGVGSDSIGFLHRTVNGPAQLFRYYTRRSIFTLTQGPAYVEFLLMPDSSWHEISVNFRWKRLAEAVKAYPVLVQKIEQNEFKLGQTAEVVRAYNGLYEEERELTVSRSGD